MKILIVKIGAIGDIIMALPVISEIRKQQPDAHITWVCGNIVASILQQVPGINEVISVDEKKMFSGSKTDAAAEILVYQKKVAFRKYDEVINYHHDSRYQIFTLLVRAKDRLHLSRNGERPGLIPARSRSFEHVRLYLRNDDNYTGDIYFPDDSISAQVLAGKENLPANDRPFVILAPGGAKNSLNEQELRRWPVHNYVEVASHLVNNGFDVIITGVKSDEWVLPYFSALPVINMVGQLSLIHLIALMRQSALVLTHDSGPFHLAVFAQHCFVIGLFGPTNPHEFTYGKRYADKVKTLWEGGHQLLCSPCYFGKLFSTQCKNNVCMQLITPHKVIQLADSLLPLHSKPVKL